MMLIVLMLAKLAAIWGPAIALGLILAWLSQQSSARQPRAEHSGAGEVDSTTPA